MAQCGHPDRITVRMKLKNYASTKAHLLTPGVVVDHSLRLNLLDILDGAEELAYDLLPYAREENTALDRDSPLKVLSTLEHELNIFLSIVEMEQQKENSKATLDEYRETHIRGLYTRYYLAVQAFKELKARKDRRLVYKEPILRSHRFQYC